jgi:hypothetical protein
MASDGLAAARPRTSGEILDDAWRLAFTDAAPLLLLSGTFLALAFAAVLLLLARPSATGWLPAAGAAGLATLTGVGSGACQEYLRRRSESRPAGVGACLAAALRRGADHVAVRAAVLGACSAGVFGFIPWLCGANPVAATFAAVLGAGYLLLPAAFVWVVAAPAHAAMACAEPGQGLLADVGPEARFDAGRSAVVTLSRVPVLMVAFFNSHLLVCIGLWTALNLAGLDVAAASAVLTVANPVYDVALAMLVWLLLAPYFEASNFLLYLDCRTRREGLDLLRRVRRAFPVAGRVGAAALTLVFVPSAMARVADGWPAAVRAAKADVDAIAAEAASADPYPGGGRWEPRLRSAGERLGGAADAQQQQRAAAWFERAITGFAGKKQSDALQSLDEMRQRLALLEEALPAESGGPAARTKESIKGLIRPRAGESDDGAPTRPEARPQDEPRHRPVERDARAPAETRGGAVEFPGGFGKVGGALLLALLLAVIGVAVARRWAASPKAPTKPTASATELTEGHAEPRPDEQPAPVLWRQAEQLARAGRHREAVRALYLAVLSHLHARRLLRYEPTRTNGEYVRQVRLAAAAPPALAEPFEQLTRCFEAVWYGGGPAAADDFEACLELAARTRTVSEE